MDIKDLQEHGNINFFSPSIRQLSIFTRYKLNGEKVI